MPELFNPNLPGQAINRPRVGVLARSGWLEWDGLTDEQQAAHTAAVDAARTAEWAALQERQDRIAAGRAAMAALNAPKHTKPPVKKTGQHKNTETPGTGETPKE